LEAWLSPASIRIVYTSAAGETRLPRTKNKEVMKNV